MPKFQLHIEGKIISSEDYAYLRELTHTTECPFFIFQVFQSSMNTEFEIKIQEQRVPRVYKKMSDEQIEDAIRLIEKGYIKSLVHKKYHVSLDYLNASIKKYKSQQIQTT
jgi:hypothetical protein